MPQPERAPCTPNHLEMRADSHSLIGEESQWSTLTRSAALSHLLKLEKNPEVPAVGRKDIVFPLSSTEGLIPWQWLEWNSEFPVATLREVWLPCCTSRKAPSSLPHLEMRPDSSFRTWDQRGFPCRNMRRCLTPLENLYKPQDPCCNRKGKLEFSPQLQMHPNSPATTREESRSVSANEKGGLTSLRDHQRFTAIPVVTPVEPRVSYCNLRKPRRFHLQGKMMPNSPALPPEQFHVPHQTWREASLPLWNYRESPGTTAQV